MMYNVKIMTPGRAFDVSKEKVSPAYKVVKWIVKTLYPRLSTEGTQWLPEEPAIIVGNHCQLHGPVACELYTPLASYEIWCASQMMEMKEVPGYAFQDFWSQKPRYTHWFYRIASYVIAPLSALIFNNAHTIPVYRDARTLATFKTTVKRLSEGASVVIFPEHDVKYNHILYDFQDRFIDVARLYHKRTGKEVQFVPMYIAPKLKKICYGEPIRFRADAPLDEERARIRQYLMDTVTQMACALPEHTVIPYRNIPKKLYPSNKLKEDSYEKTGG